MKEDDYYMGKNTNRETGMDQNQERDQFHEEDQYKYQELDIELGIGLGLGLDLDLEQAQEQVQVQDQPQGQGTTLSQDNDQDQSSPSTLEATADSLKKEPEKEENKSKMELYDWLQCIVSAIIVGIFIFVFIGRTIGVDGSSMMQTLHNNDRVVMSNLFYTPKKGDVVVFQAASDSFGGTPLVKRVIAVAGQTIDIDFDTGEVTIDNVVQDEPYINELTHSRLNFSGPVTVPEGNIFVMGDNRNHSSDSRDSRVGLVDTRYVLGRVLFLVIPGADEQHPRDLSRIGLIH